MRTLRRTKWLVFILQALAKHATTQLFFRLQDSDDPSALYRNLKRERDWHDYAQMEVDKKRTGPGEGGQPVHVPESMQEQQNALYRVR